MKLDKNGRKKVSFKVPALKSKDRLNVFRSTITYKEYGGNTAFVKGTEKWVYSALKHPELWNYSDADIEKLASAQKESSEFKKGDLVAIDKSGERLKVLSVVSPVKIIVKDKSGKERVLSTNQLTKITESMKKIPEGRKEEYQKFFNGALKKFGVESPSELDDEKKKEFFDYIDKNWDGEGEKKESADIKLDGRTRVFKEKCRALGLAKSKMTDEQVTTSAVAVNDKPMKHLDIFKRKDLTEAWLNADSEGRVSLIKEHGLQSIYSSVRQNEYKLSVKKSIEEGEEVYGLDANNNLVKVDATGISIIENIEEETTPVYTIEERRLQKIVSMVTMCEDANVIVPFIRANNISLQDKASTILKKFKKHV